MSNGDIVLVANSPGELSALVKPVAEKIHQKLEETRIILLLTPCQYASGKELEFIKTIQEIKEVIKPKEYQRWILLNRSPKIKFAKKGLVLFLGGDLTHAVLIARKLKYPAFACLQERIGWIRFYKKFFVPDAETFWRFAKNPALKEKIKIVGNLMVDSVSRLKKWTPEERVISFLPGSRRWEIDFMTPLYEKILKAMKKEMPEIKFQIASSPFVAAKPFGGAKIVSWDQVWNSELVITIPGTNTAKLAALGIPMLVVFPLNQPEVIPLEGLPHFIGKVPLLGRVFKKTLAKIIDEKTPFFALPNIKAEREIVPEIRGEIDPGFVALKAITLLKDKNKRYKMSKELIEAMGPGGAAEKIVEEISASL